MAKKSQAKTQQMKISCPHCKKDILLDELLTQQIQEKATRQLQDQIEDVEKMHEVEKKKFMNQLEKNKKELENAKKSLNKQVEEVEKTHEAEKKKFMEQLERNKKELEKTKKSLDKQIEEAVESQREALEKEARKKAEKSSELLLKDLKEQVSEKQELLEKAQNEELKLRKEQRQLEEDKRAWELEIQRKMDEQKEILRAAIIEQVVKEHELKDLEKQKQIDDMTKQIGELKRKAEQGSQKIQGEVFELEIERILKKEFIHDIIEPIASGTRGADILQRVCLSNEKECGSILFEVKQAKNWSKGWIAKLQEDMQTAHADMGVIVSTVLPENLNKEMAYVSGILIIVPTYLVPMVSLLRQQLMNISVERDINVCRDEKMQRLYQYLTGNEFKQKLQAIVTAYQQMRGDLEKEKRSMQKFWSQREKQLERAITQMIDVREGIRSVAGSELPEIKELDSPESEIDEDDA